MSDLRFHEWAYAVTAALFGLHIAVGQAKPIKHAFMRSGPESIFEWTAPALVQFSCSPAITAC